MKRLFAVVPVLFTLLTACASDPMVGDDCSAGEGACSSSTEALFCESGKLKAIPCGGPAGCIEGSDKVSCDFSKAKAGEACPSANENQGQCDAANADQLLRCSSGTWKAETCKGCAIQGSSVVCQQ